MDGDRDLLAELAEAIAQGPIIFTPDEEFLKRINDTKKFNLDEESLFMEFEYKILNG